MNAPRVERRPIDGLLLVDKPGGITSHDVVSVARRALGTRRIGHGGTLDPFATGLLVLLIGHATRLLPHLDGEPKVYDASIAFGGETDTDDVTGTVVATAPLPGIAAILAGLPSLTGAIDQVPPAYSAKQVDGRRAYDAARRGAALELEPVRVSVHEWRVREISSERLDATIVCGGGTYIRALARDLGRLCGSAAHLASLRRTRSGPFDVTDAVSLETLNDRQAVPRPALDAVAHLPQVRLSPTDVINVRHGRAIAVDPAASSAIAARLALIDDAGRLVAIADRIDAMWQPRVVLPDA